MPSFIDHFANVAADTAANVAADTAATPITAAKWQETFIFSKMPKEKFSIILKYSNSLAKANVNPKENYQKKNESMLASDHNKKPYF